LLAPEIELVAIQYPGRQERHREGCITSIPELSDRIFEALNPWTERPFAFFGHSMGAVLAFEVARRCEAAMDATPMRLFASGRRAPSCQRIENVHLRDDRGVADEMRRLGATDERLLADEELLAMILRVVRADYRAIETYSCPPGAVLECPVTVLVGDADPQVTLDEASAWSDHSNGDFDLRIFPGGHFYLDSHHAEVAGLLSASLDTTALLADFSERSLH
jgi:surfactin synthase thioesterase subunit